MNKTIWMYWENKKGFLKPAYLDLCLETIIKHSPNYKVIVLNENNISSYLPSLRKDLHKIVDLAHKADYIRAKIMFELGGIWLDSDVILLQEIDIEDYLKKYEYVGCSKNYGEPSIWFFAAREKCDILGQWIEAMDSVLDKKLSKTYKPKFKEKKYKWFSTSLKIINIFNIRSISKIVEKNDRIYEKKLSKLGSLGWSEIGYDILWKLFQGYEYYNFDYNKFAPYGWEQWEEFFRKDLNVNEIISDDSIAIMLYNKFMYKPLMNISKNDILRGETLLSKAFRYSLGIVNDT